MQALGDSQLPAPLSAAPEDPLGDGVDALRTAYNRTLGEIGADSVAALRAWPGRVAEVTRAGVRVPRARPGDPRG